MTEKLILEAAVAIPAVWENTARGSGKKFWRVDGCARDPMCLKAERAAEKQGKSE